MFIITPTNQKWKHPLAFVLAISHKHLCSWVGSWSAPEKVWNTNTLKHSFINKVHYTYIFIYISCIHTHWQTHTHTHLPHPSSSPPPHIPYSDTHIYNQIHMLHTPTTPTHDVHKPPSTHTHTHTHDQKRNWHIYQCAEWARWSDTVSMCSKLSFVMTSCTEKHKQNYLTWLQSMKINPHPQKLKLKNPISSKCIKTKLTEKN